jgi:hypothetical protein
MSIIDSGSGRSAVVLVDIASLIHQDWQGRRGRIDVDREGQRATSSSQRRRKFRQYIDRPIRDGRDECARQRGGGRAKTTATKNDDAQLKDGTKRTRRWVAPTARRTTHVDRGDRNDDHHTMSPSSSHNTLHRRRHRSPSSQQNSNANYHRANNARPLARTIEGRE